ncbi:MAG TPA: hypothetical protein VJY31_08915 [Buttiauxella sp.]|nr:hypothetical protein [Buttiauxella sp.]
MSRFIDEQPTKRHYIDSLKEISAFEATKEPLRIVSAADMTDACDLFLAGTRCHIPDRLPREKGDRRELGRKVEWNLPKDWKPRAEWKEHVQHALQILNQRTLDNRISELDEWPTWAELETDIHIAVRCSRKTVEFYHRGDLAHLPHKTDLFAVPTDFSKFLGSVIAGDIQPVWMWSVDAARTPKCYDGYSPRYQPLPS